MRQTIPVPAGIAPTRVTAAGPAYSHVVVASGKLVFIAGQLARGESGKIVGKGDWPAQIRQVCENIGLALASVGATFTDVVESITFVTDMAEYRKHSDVRRQ